MADSQKVANFGAVVLTSLPWEEIDDELMEMYAHDPYKLVKVLREALIPGVVLNRSLFLRITGIDFSVRTHNAIAHERFNFLWELAVKNESELKKLGKRALDEIKEELGKRRLYPGMQFTDQELNLLKAKTY